MNTVNLSPVKVTVRCWCGAELVEDRSVTAGRSCPRADLLFHGVTHLVVQLALAALLLALAGCASFSDGSGQNSKWGHQASYAERCQFESGGCPTLRSRLAKIPGLGWLFRPVGIGPCLPVTDQGAPQPCGGWPVLGPGAHAVPQQKAPPRPPGPGTPERGAPAAGKPGAPSAACPPGCTPDDAPLDPGHPGICIGGHPPPCDAPPPAKPRRTAAELLLRLLSKETYDAVEQGGGW